MKKHLFFVSVLFISFTVSGQNMKPLLSEEKETIANFMQLTPQQLYDTANYYFKKTSYDTALIYSNLFLNTPSKDNDVEHIEKVAGILNRMGIIYTDMSDYRSAYKYLIDGLLISEKSDDVYLKARIYNNLGVIFGYFEIYDIAKTYFHKALSLTKDVAMHDYYLNNLGAASIELEEIDSAFIFYNQALLLSNEYNTGRLSSTMHGLGLLYKNINQYDSALHYFKLALTEARNINNIGLEILTLANLGKLFFEVNKPDSALFYIGLSNKAIAENRILLGTMADNFLELSKYEESRGNIKAAFEYHKKYSHLKDSVYNTDILTDINQLQRLYEFAKTNQQIEQLTIEKKVIERTNYLQRIIIIIVICILISAIIVIIIINLMRIKLKKSYEILFIKNEELLKLEKKHAEKIEIINQENHIEDNQEINLEKYKHISLSEDLKNTILNNIKYIMDNDPAVFQPDFTLLKLSKLVNSNHSHVSYIINDVFNENFNTFLNRYRIKEAQRIFSTSNSKILTVNRVANKVGFKSRSAFHNAFKENTGLTPNYYLKKIQNG
jgi:AraC-like DNA-binding protein/Tfp pilus assembly protein PilF